jgi:lipase chaperone LimK
MILPKPLILIGGIAFAVILGVFFYWYTCEPDRQTQTAEPASTQITVEESITIDEPALTIDEEKESVEIEASSPLQIPDFEPENTPAFDNTKVSEILGLLIIDENGNLVIDSYAKKVLKNAFIELKRLNDPMVMNQLQDFIQSELPGMAGKQASDIISNYYEYRVAESELLEQNLSLAERAATFDFEELFNMRRAYLGQDVADMLFAEEEMLTRYTFALMELDQNPDLSSEQKKERQKTLESEIRLQIAALNETDPPVESRYDSTGDSSSEIAGQSTENDTAWSERFLSYWGERQNIISAGLSENDKQQQITRLQNVYFSEDEMERVKINELQLKIKESLLDTD